jgi:hypothetical protein
MALKLRLVPRPALTARVAPRLGATIAAEAPLASALAGGAYTLSLDVAGLAALSSLPAAERDNLFVPNSPPGSRLTISHRRPRAETSLFEMPRPTRGFRRAPRAITFR